MTCLWEPTGNPSERMMTLQPKGIRFDHGRSDEGVLHGCAVAQVLFEREEAHQVEDLFVDTEQSNL